MDEERGSAGEIEEVEGGIGIKALSWDFLFMSGY